jgi:hypothetical protein
VLAVAGAIALFSCAVCDAVGFGLAAYSIAAGVHSASQGHYAQAGFDGLNALAFGVGRDARLTEEAEGGAAAAMGAKADRLARQGRAYAHQDELDAARSAAEDAHLTRAVTRTYETGAWAYNTSHAFQ